MSARVAPNLVTDGLIFALDAANPKSYVSESTVWNDLTSNIYTTASLLNNPTYNSEALGSISMNGINQAYKKTFRTTVVDYTAISFCKITDMNKNWIPIFEFTSLPNAVVINDHYYVQGNLNPYSGQIGGFGCSLNSVGVSSWTSSNLINVQQGVWYMFTGRKLGGNGDTFVNLNKSKNTLTFTPNSVNTVYFQNFRAIASDFFYLGGLVSNVLLYNRGLSDMEILQNYNALKGRFGLP